MIKASNNCWTNQRDALKKQAIIILILMNSNSKTSLKSTDKDSPEVMKNEILSQFNQSSSFPIKVKARIEFLTDKVKKTLDEIKCLIDLMKDKFPSNSNSLLMNNIQKSHNDDISLFSNRNIIKFEESNLNPYFNYKSDIDQEFVNYSVDINNLPNIKYESSPHNLCHSSDLHSIFHNSGIKDMNNMMVNLKDIRSHLVYFPGDEDLIENVTLSNDSSNRRNKKYNMHTPEFKRKLCELAKTEGTKI